jgi:hypothetical protein
MFPSFVLRIGSVDNNSSCKFSAIISGVASIGASSSSSGSPSSRYRVNNAGFSEELVVK